MIDTSFSIYDDGEFSYLPIFYDLHCSNQYCVISDLADLINKKIFMKYFETL